MRKLLEMDFPFPVMLVIIMVGLLALGGGVAGLLTLIIEIENYFCPG